MKKLKYLLISLLLIIPISAKAANVHCSVPSSVESGQTFNVKFYGSLGGAGGIWFGRIGFDGNASYVSGNLSFNGEETNNFSRTVTFKAGNPGTAKFYAYDVDAASDNEQISSSDTCTVNIVAATKSNGSSNKTNNNKNNNSNKSNNNNLKKLNIDGVELSPEFNKDTLEYTATVEGDKNKISIEAEPEDGKASIDGDGEKDLEEGPNELIITVRAENGDAKEYKLIITRKELNPIEVTIHKKKYTVVKKETDIEIPEGFEKETIKIGEADVIAYSNKTYTLVVLVDEEGNKGLFIYDKKNNSYSKFVVFKTTDLKLMIIEAKSKDIPYGYKEIEFTIDGEKVKGYYYKSKDKFRLVYAVNEEDGKEGFYQYDMEQKTFQRFNDTQVKEYLVYLRYIMYFAAGAGLLIIILFGSVITLVSKNRKLKKGEVKEEPKEEKKPETREERRLQKEEKVKDEYSLDDPEEEEEVVDKRALKKEQKRLAKEAKKKEKEEKKLVKAKAKEKSEEVDKKALKKLQKEEDKKRKEEANDFLK